MQYKPIRKKGGFTLIELIVVIALMGIVMFTALPRFQRQLMDPTRAASRWILWKVPQLKEQAVTENRNITLLINVSGNRLLVTHAGMTPEETEAAMENGHEFPEGFQLTDVEFPGDRFVSSGTAKIQFYKGGYSDRAILHAKADDETQLSFFIEPFLNHVKLVESHAGYNE